MLDSSQQETTQHGTAPRIAPMERSASRAVRRAIEYIHANLEGSVRLGNIAGVAGLSVFHFSRTFRQVTGLTPHRYLTRARVERVKDLLLEGDHGLAAIADEAGFSDQSHMSKAFRRLTGTSPAAFRNEYRQETAAIYGGSHHRNDGCQRQPELRFAGRPAPEPDCS